MEHLKSRELKRELSAGSLAIHAINLTIGAGIFVLPAIVALKLGNAGFLAYLICGMLLILIMLCFAEVGSRITTAGGAYAYVEAAFGPYFGFLINTLLWFGYIIMSDAALINLIADSLSIWHPAFTLLPVRVMVFLIILGFFSLINIRGMKTGNTLVITLTLIKLTPLFLIIIVGIFYVSSDNLLPVDWPELVDLGEISLVLFFAFIGTETALNVSGEVKKPSKSIPKAIFMGVAGILIIYILIQFVAQGVMGDELAKHQEAPLSALANHFISPLGGTLIALATIISIVGTLGSDILVSPRVLYAASHNRLLPAFLSKIHPRFATPYWSIIVFVTLIVIVASTGTFKQLAVISSSATLIIYLAVVLSSIALRYKNRAEKQKTFKIPGGYTIHVLAIITITWLLSHITRSELFGLILFFAIISVFYFITKKLRK